MTTDITELAQSLKAAAEKATPGCWEYYPGNTSIEYNVDSMDEDQGSIVYVDSGDFTQAQTDRNGEFIALANPANILALVESLEKAQPKNALVAGGIDAAAKLHERISELEGEVEKWKQESGAWERVADKQIAIAAELESRNVKLPAGYTASSGHPFNEAERTVMIPGGGDWLNRIDVEHALTVEGIKWEAV